MQFTALRIVDYGPDQDYTEKEEVKVNLEKTSHWNLLEPSPRSNQLEFQSEDPEDLDYAESLNESVSDYDEDDDEDDDEYTPPAVTYVIRDRHGKVARRILEYIALSKG
jgi:hypothetical protein